MSKFDWILKWEHWDLDAPQAAKKVLGLEHNKDYDPTEIHKAYLRQLRIFHPDKNQSEISLATQANHVISAAAEYLKSTHLPDNCFHIYENSLYQQEKQKKENAILDAIRKKSVADIFIQYNQDRPFFLDLVASMSLAERSKIEALLVEKNSAKAILADMAILSRKPEKLEKYLSNDRDIILLLWEHLHRLTNKEYTYIKVDLKLALQYDEYLQLIESVVKNIAARKKISYSEFIHRLVYKDANFYELYRLLPNDVKAQTFVLQHLSNKKTSLSQKTKIVNSIGGQEFSLNSLPHYYKNENYFFSKASKRKWSMLEDWFKERDPYYETYQLVQSSCAIIAPILLSGTLLIFLYTPLISYFLTSGLSSLSFAAELLFQVALSGLVSLLFLNSICLIFAAKEVVDFVGGYYALQTINANLKAKPADIEIPDATSVSADDTKSTYSVM